MRLFKVLALTFAFLFLAGCGGEEGVYGNLTMEKPADYDAEPAEGEEGAAEEGAAEEGAAEE